jgi:WD40 repeat protein
MCDGLAGLNRNVGLNLLYQVISGAALSLTSGPLFSPYVVATGGSDGTVALWQRQERQKLSFAFAKPAAPAVDGRWNAAGDLFVIGSSYDWSRGHEGYNRDAPNTITVRHTPEAGSAKLALTQIGSAAIARAPPHASSTTRKKRRGLIDGRSI